MNVLIVEDDAGVARFLRQAMAEADYQPQWTGDGLEGLRLAQEGDFDLILLDLMLPGMDGLEICRRLRVANIGTPILMLTARDLLEDKVAGLDAGADDYIVKPFQLAELLARARALLRRGISGPTTLTVQDLTLEPATRTVTRASKTVLLSATEYTLLEYLMRNVGRTVTRSMILEHVWQYDFDGNDNVLDVYISYLRRKLDKKRPASVIQTVRGVGYRMDADADA
jgi:DNA-binding response OmpR family regulator